MRIEILRVERFDKIIPLIQDYKESIGEEYLKENQLSELKRAISDNRISFFVAIQDEDVVGMCSISTIFSTYKCEAIGIFEDFYIKSECRRKGIARALTQHVFREMRAKNINSVWVGCADVDVEMYTHIGFDIKLGNLLTWSNE